MKTAKPSQAAPIAEAGGRSGESEMSHSSEVRAPALTGFMISISHTEVYRAWHEGTTDHGSAKSSGISLIQNKIF